MLEEDFLRKVVRCATANGWRFDIEDCFPKQQRRTAHFLGRHFKILEKPLNFLYGKRKQIFTLIYHTYDSRRSKQGFPDLVMVHPRRGQIIFAELKIKGNYPSTEQRLWLAALDSAAYNNANMLVVLWTDHDWPEIVAALGGIDTGL